MSSHFAYTGNSMMGQMTSLHQQRLEVAFRTFKKGGASAVLDLGCGAGALLCKLAADPQFTTIKGLEPCGTALHQARQVLAPYLADTPQRIRLIRGSYTDSHSLLADYDAAAMIETIEHVRPDQLSRVERVVFAEMRPRRIFMTTPNRDYNPMLDLGPGELREADHKFEWSRIKFRQWVEGVARRNGYGIEFGGIGEPDPELGHPTQTALFVRTDAMETVDHCGSVPGVPATRENRPTRSLRS